MKRMFVLVVALLIGTTATVKAQVKIDEAAIKAKISKLKEASEDPKKGAKAAAWLELGKAYSDAAVAPYAPLYKGMDEKTAGLMLGTPTAEGTETIDGVEYKKLTYPFQNTYFKDGVLQFWIPTQLIIENALEQGVAAYVKAGELDAKAAPKVKEGLDKIVNYYKQDAENYFAGNDLKNAATNFEAVFLLQQQPPLNVIDTMSCFNAGFIYTVLGDFPKGQKYLAEAIKNGYENNGDAYYYLYHSYFGAKDAQNAKQALLDGIGKYPTNNNLVEGLLGLYATTGEDPNAIIPYVMKAIETDPKNAELYVGLGRIYDKMGENAKSVDAFKKSVELAPESFANNFNLGFTLVKRGDNLATALKDKPFTNQEAYNASLKELNATYAMALPSLEKAYQLNPQERMVVELLKNVYFRLRDESPEMMANYNKYNDLFKSM